MRIIDRYICREVFSHALLGLAVFTFVLFIPQLVRLMELVVRHSADAGTIGLLLLSTLPAVLTFTVPMATLLGVLIGLGRMSADSEVIALHALGFGLRRVLLPVGALALLSALLTASCTFWLGPLALGTLRAVEERLRATQASFQIQPRVFDERFPRFVLYVHDVEAAATRWRGIFLAEADPQNVSRLTLAEGAIVIAGHEQGKLQLHLQNGSTHEFNRSEPDRYSVSTFGESDLPIAVAGISGTRPRQPVPRERSAGELLAAEGPAKRESRVEFHRRLAMPAACLVFVLVAVPLGARPRRGGRAGGFVVTLLIVCAYYVAFITGAGLARQGTLPAVAGMWLANILTALAGIALLPRMERSHRESFFSRWRRTRPVETGARVVSISELRPSEGFAEAAWGGRLRRRRWSLFPGFPLLFDLYVLRRFFYFFAAVLMGFLLLFNSFTFFELLDDIARNHIAHAVVANYFVYLAPHLVYQLAPLAALVAVLVTLGILAKNNEVTAFQAGGVSLYRLAVPLFVAGGLVAAGMLAFDSAILPTSNPQQDALRNQIKGRPAQTFYQPRRSWIFGNGGRLYNYEVFDPDSRLFGGLSVFVLDQNTFQLRRRVFATRAHWEPRLSTWVLEEGWTREFAAGTVTSYLPFSVTSLPELAEPPAYFHREVRQHYQMDWRALRRYIQELEQAGFDVARLSVQWHRKFAFPLIAPVMVLLSVPFALLVGTRGALGGIALAIGIAVVYWALSALFEAFGAVGQLPPALAAWAPDAIFAFAGLYFFLKMPT